MAESTAKARIGSPGKSFWKKSGNKVPGSVKPVYGAQHPPLMHNDLTSSPNKGPAPRTAPKGKKVTSFDEFNTKTSDAWDESDPWDAAEPEEIVPTAKGTVPPRVERREERSQSGRGLRSASRGSGRHSSGVGGSGTTATLPDRDTIRLQKFEKLLAGPNTDLEELKKLAWGGIPGIVRSTTWKLLCGYLPANVERRHSTLDRKRQEYERFLAQYYKTRLDSQHEQTFRQISIDVPRMIPSLSLMNQTAVQETFERVLYIWAMRHPASGYVQGINDLLTPFFIVFLKEHIGPSENLDKVDVSSLARETLAAVEADSYWCMSHLLDGIQDNYTFAQPGIQTKVNGMREVVNRVDASLHRHLAENSVEYLQFSFRWFNNILMRELPLRCVIRLWDTYHAEANGFGNFHLYVCSAFLVRFSKSLLQEKDFQGIMTFLQNLPTSRWGDDEISVLLSEAYQLKYMFADAPSHLQSTTTT
ncbi:TBC1 domain family member 22A-like [Oscarella lobularis]|uniref:TBC1 domain family member 22A-like n=1 Tax=Oscarella lobularis TaxID=121494 RepID=UPI003314247B